MPELPPKEKHESPERFPSQEEVRAVLAKILQGKPYEELGSRDDEEGLCFFEAVVTLEDGEKREYNYQKAKYNYKDTSLPGKHYPASIHMTKYDIDGILYDGECVANYTGADWEYVS